MVPCVSLVLVLTFAIKQAMDTQASFEIVFQNILESFELLKHNVPRALRAQLGDVARLRHHRRLCRELLDHINTVRVSLFKSATKC